MTVELSELAGIVQQGFKEMHEEFAAVNARIDKLEVRMNGLEQRMDGLEVRVGGLETRMDKMEERMINIESDLNFLSRTYGEHSVMLNRLIN